MAYDLVSVDLARDRDAIISFWDRHHQQSLKAKFDWMYLRNPAGPAMVWMVRHRGSGELVGMTSLFPRRFVLGSRVVLGAVAGDLFVSAVHRSAGPALMLQRALLEAADRGAVNFVLAFPNARSEPIIRRVGYQRIAPLITLVRAVRTSHYLAAAGLPQGMARCLGGVADFP
jgi:hypothetical protein